MKRDLIYTRIQELIMEGANLGNYTTNYTLISNNKDDWMKASTQWELVNKFKTLEFY